MATAKKVAKSKAVKATSVKVAAAPIEPPQLGCPTKYKAEYAELAYNYCLMGASEPDLQRLFDVSPQTLYNWRSLHPDFLEGCKKGKEEADAKVARALFLRATGYEHPEDDIRVVAGQIEITPTIKRYPPDTGAAMAWLKNRQPHLWREKVEVEHSGNLTVKRLTDAQLMEIAARGLQGD